jgi:hypothetical protein
VNVVRVKELLSALEQYRQGRMALLRVLGLNQSNRDPLAEWSEHLVAALLGAKLVTNRVQADYDLTTSAGAKVQVRYLANPENLPGAWVNEHRVTSVAGVDRYALVIFEGFRPMAVLVFPSDLTRINSTLAKKAPTQDSVLQFTRSNYLKILANKEALEGLGMTIWHTSEGWPAAWGQSGR